jgi:hypothetical protein
MRVYKIYKENDTAPIYTTDFMDIWDILDSAEDAQKVVILHKELTHAEYMQIPAEQKKEIQE